MSTTDEVIGQGVQESPGPEAAPLSYTQQQLWFAEQIDPDQSLYTEALSVRIRGTINPDTLARALQEILRRHEALRTVFPLVDDQPVQHVLPADTPLTLERSAVVGATEGEREAALCRQVTDFVEQPLDLTRDLLTKALLISATPEDHVLAVILHHVVCDGLSGRVIFAELGRLYEAYEAGQPSPLPEPELQYIDFTEWERTLHESGYLDDDIEYWRERLAGVEPVLELPARRTRPDSKAVRGIRAQFPLADSALYGKITDFCRDHGVSVYALTLAAFSATVSRYTGQRDMVFGTLAANRARSELENVVGNFTNTLPMRMDLTGDPTLLELVGRATRTSEEAIEHGLVSLGKIIELISPRRDPSRNALIQHLFLTSGQPASDTTWGSASITPFDVPRNRGRLDTIVEVEERGTELISWVEYDTELLEHDEVEQLMGHFATVIRTWLESPGGRLSELPLLEQAEIDEHLRQSVTAMPSSVSTEVPVASLAVTAPAHLWTFGQLRAMVSYHLVETGLDDVRVSLGSADLGETIALVLACATRGTGVVLCACADPEAACACQEIEAQRIVRAAHGVADAFWSDGTGKVLLADDTPPVERLLFLLAGVLRGTGSTIVQGSLTGYLDETPAVVVAGSERIADSHPNGPTGPHNVVVTGQVDPVLVDRLTASGHAVYGLVGHDDVLGPVVRVRHAAGEPVTAAPLPHVDAVVLDEYAHVPPLGVLGGLHTYGTVTNQLVHTGLTARRTARDSVEVLLESENTAAASVGEAQDDSPLHELVRELWCDVLEVDTIAPDDDFFELGGHSMVSARMIERVRELVQVDVPLRMLFAHSRFDEFVDALRIAYPEVDDIVAVLGNLSADDAALLMESVSAEPSDGPEEERERARQFPLTSAQLQIWLMEYLRGAGITYTIPLEFHLTGPCNVDLLRRSIQRIVDRHDMLRVTVELTEAGEPLQVVHDNVTLDIPFTDLTKPDAGETAEEIRRGIGYAEFDVATGPLLKAHIVRTASDKHTLYIVFHHIVMDERSMTLFMGELSTIYTAELQGTPLPPGLSVQIGDYVEWESAQLTGEPLERLRKYWRSRLEGVPELVLPMDFERPSKLSFDGEFLYRPQERALFDDLATLASAHHVTPYIAFTAATSLLLHRLSGQDRFVIGMPSDSRGMPGSDELIGCFINVMPVRVDCDGSPTFVDLMLRLREEIVGGYDHRALPLSAIVEAVGVPRHADRLPLFQVTTELQHDTWMPFELPGCEVEYGFIGHGTARYDTAFHAMVKADTFEVCAEVNSGIYTFETGYRRLDQLASLLRQIVQDPTKKLTDYTI